MKCSVFVFFHQFNSFSFSSFGRVSVCVCVCGYSIQVANALAIISIINRDIQYIHVCGCELCNGSMCANERIWSIQKRNRPHRVSKRPTLSTEMITQRRTPCRYTKSNSLLFNSNKPLVHLCARMISLSLYLFEKYVNTWASSMYMYTNTGSERSPHTHTHIHKSLLKPHHSTCSALAHWYLCWNRLRVCASLVCCLRISFISFHFFFFTSLSRVCLPIFRSCNDGNQQVVSI